MVTLGTIRDCVQCNAETKSKRRCTRTTCLIEGQCWQHSAASTGLRVKNSRIPGAGKGLFADRDIPKGRRIVEYAKKSNFMPGPVDLSRSDDRHPYAICLTPRRCWDARSTQSTQARYSNGCDKPGRNDVCNAKMTPLGWLVSTRRIQRGDEILFPYGPDYWET
jgi:uncharacterized protein